MVIIVQKESLFILMFIKWDSFVLSEDNSIVPNPMTGATGNMPQFIEGYCQQTRKPSCLNANTPYIVELVNN